MNSALRTPITYYGGKQSMVSDILPMIPPHRIYVEPFFGGGAIFFAKPKSYLEVINDVNNNLIIFYQVMKDQFEELNEMISNTLHSENQYFYAKDIYNRRIEATDLQIAWSVWVVTNMSFSGSIHGSWKWCNGSAGSHTGRFIKKKSAEFYALRNRLSGVQINNRDALRVIEDRDTKDTFFYLDPPYPGSEQQHYAGYKMSEFDKLLTVLGTIKGKFILSNFPSQTLRWHILKNGWNCKSKILQMKVANFTGKRYKTELLISNFKLLEDLFSPAGNNNYE